MASQNSTLNFQEAESPEKFLEQNIHRTQKVTGVGLITYEEAVEIIRLTRLENETKFKEDSKKNNHVKEKFLQVIKDADVYINTNDGRELICKKSVATQIEGIKI